MKERVTDRRMMTGSLDLEGFRTASKPLGTQSTRLLKSSVWETGVGSAAGRVARAPMQLGMLKGKMPLSQSSPLMPLRQSSLMPLRQSSERQSSIDFEDRVERRAAAVAESTDSDGSNAAICRLGEVVAPMTADMATLKTTMVAMQEQMLQLQLQSTQQMSFLAAMSETMAGRTGLVAGGSSSGDSGSEVEEEGASSSEEELYPASHDTRLRV